MKKDVQYSFDLSIIGPLSMDGLIDISEQSVDDIVDIEIIKQIPIVKTVLGMMQTGLNIRDRLFLKKILAFLSGISHISEKERREMINKIDDSKKYRIKVGEKLLYILDNCDDYINAENVAKLFSSMIGEKIDYEEYLEAARIISRISANELNLFMQSYDSPSLCYEAANLLHTGLVFVDSEKPEVKVIKHEPVDWDDSPEYYSSETSGGETLLYSTRVGDVIFKVFGSEREWSII